MTVQKTGPRSGELLARRLFRSAELTTADLASTKTVKAGILPYIYGDDDRRLRGLASEPCSQLIAEAAYLVVPALEQAQLLTQQRHQALYAASWYIANTFGGAPVFYISDFLDGWRHLGNDLRLWDQPTSYLPIEPAFRKVAYWGHPNGYVRVLYGITRTAVQEGTVGLDADTVYVEEALRRWKLTFGVPVDAALLQAGPGPYQHD
jgi:hypothetical protein